MAVRVVLQYPHPFLRRTCRDVVAFDADLHRLCDDLVETMTEFGGQGLAAPQVGDERRVFVVAAGLSGLQPRVIINPRITAKAKTYVAMVEGCLSLVNEFVQLERPAEIDVEFVTRDTAPGHEGEFLPMRCTGVSGLFARVFQHEQDHLGGRMFFERIKDRNHRSLITRGR